MEYKHISLRGDNEGIIITVKDGQLDDIIKEIECKVESSIDFFRGAKVKGIVADSLKNSDVKRIESLLKSKYEMVILDKQVQSKRPVKKTSEVEVNEVGFFKGIDEGNTKFIKNTVRSGQLLTVNGNAVVLGDVNPGGIIAAKGNVVVLGTLKGIAKAGIDGNREAFIAAYRLEPTQLKIAEIITRRPDDDYDKPEWPELARIQDGMIVIESYLNKGKR